MCLLVRVLVGGEADGATISSSESLKCKLKDDESLSSNIGDPPKSPGGGAIADLLRFSAVSGISSSHSFGSMDSEL